jgi:hypothetical protein
MNNFGVYLHTLNRLESRPERVARIICQSRCDGDAHICDLTSEGICKPEACRFWSLHLDTANKIIAELKDTL